MTPPLPTLYDLNLAKIDELKPEVQWAGNMWVTECDDTNLRFRIVEAYRSQKRQDQLYAQGRTLRGQIVTWTKTSRHTERLAVDVEPLNCTFEQIEKVANRFGIYRPADLVKLGDRGHFQFDKVTAKAQVIIDPQREQRRLARLVHSETNPQRRQRLQKRLDALEFAYSLPTLV